jgi:hypothetical protein
MTMIDDVLAALRREVEGPLTDDGFRDVYLDNASGDLDLTPRQFAGYLSILQQRGLYRTLDNYAFGQVKMAEPNVQVDEKRGEE